MYSWEKFLNNLLFFNRINGRSFFRVAQIIAQDKQSKAFGDKMKLKVISNLIFWFFLEVDKWIITIKSRSTSCCWFAWVTSKCKVGKKDVWTKSFLKVA